MMRNPVHDVTQNNNNLFYKLQIVLTPTNRAQKKGYCNVTVQVLDANDNTPYFASEQYRLQVLENQQQRTFIGEITVGICISR